jgi:hypothetical protein
MWKYTSWLQICQRFVVVTFNTRQKCGIYLKSLHNTHARGELINIKFIYAFRQSKSTTSVSWLGPTSYFVSMFWEKYYDPFIIRFSKPPIRPECVWASSLTFSSWKLRCEDYSFFSSKSVLIIGSSQQFQRRTASQGVARMFRRFLRCYLHG